MRAVRKEDGFTLVELLVASSLLIIVLLATLALADAFGTTNTRNTNQNAAQEAARAATDQLARELRNAASPGSSTPVERAQGNDLVFDTIDPDGPGGGTNTSSIRRVRYCVDSGVPSNVRLWKQVQKWTTSTPPSLPGSSTCPDPAYTSQRIVVDHMVSSAGSVFSYDSGTLAKITEVTTSLSVDVDPGKPPGASQLTTSAFIRSVDAPPASAFTATALGNRKVLLNGGASTDGSNQSLSYYWYDGATQIGTASVLEYTAPATGSRTFTLKVVDNAGQSASSTQTVTVN